LANAAREHAKRIKREVDQSLDSRAGLLSLPLPAESSAARSLAFPNLVLRLCFEIAGVMMLVQLI
jgi:hypothetical protein